LLVEILPYPHPNNSDWLYERFQLYLRRDEYEKTMLSRRIELLRDIIDTAPRRAIICYGKGKRIWGKPENRERYKQLFPDA
jgi:hypothetical protein